VTWERKELEQLLRDGELEPVPSPDALWPALWSLGDLPDGDSDTGGGTGPLAGIAGLSDGTAIWFAATQQRNAPLGATGGGATGGGAGGGAAAERLEWDVAPFTAGADKGEAPFTAGADNGEAPFTVEAVPATELADAALRVWLHFFAGHAQPDNLQQTE
jgi:hypothetical protein